MKSYVYIITNNVNSKKYVGKSNNPKQRWRHHVYYAARGVKTYLAQALNAYGPESFTFEIVSEWSTEDEAFSEETRLIVELQTNNRDKGYNLNEGGEGGRNPSQETREKIGNANRGRTLSVEARQKISEAAKKRSSKIAELARQRFKGCKLSEEHKEKLRVTSAHIKRANTFSEDARYRMGTTNRGKHLSEEHKRKIGDACRGKKRSEETRQKMRKQRTPEQRERCRIAALKRWEKKRNEQNNQD